MNWQKLVIGAALAVAAAPTAAADPWRLCPAWPQPSFEAGDGDLAHSPLQMQADVLESLREGESIFSGRVRLNHGPRTLTADRLRYERNDNTVRAEGAIRYSDKHLDIESGHALLELDPNRIKFDAVQFRLHQRRARGSAASLDALEEHPIALRDVRYTSCPEDNEAWTLRAPSIDLDTEEGIGTGRNVRVMFKGVPIFYTPWISFPLDDQRKSGFLIPDIGRARNTGIDIRAPWYWNIAPDKDATITPRWIQERGTQVGVEFRYLRERSFGQFDLEVLPSDSQTGETRGVFNWAHHAEPAAGWRYRVDFAHASDNDYFEDLAGGLEATVRTHVGRHAELSFHGDRNTVIARLDGWQTLDNTIALGDRPYARLPQVYWRSVLPLGAGPTLELESELVLFDAADNRVTGARIDVAPALQWAMGGPAWHLVPRAAFRHTRYQLDGAPPGATAPSRSLPTFSLDAGLAFERAMGGERLQTLEPRIRWLSIPFRDQAALPLFDTSAPDFNLVQLYEDNRFNGSDRVGDTQQVTLGMATRILSSASGDELVAVQAGRIRYFDDRAVALPGEPAQTEVWSDIIAEAVARVSDDWSARLGLQYDPDAQRIERSTVSLRWHPGNERLLNLGWRFRRGQFDQTDLSFAWPLSSRWSAVGRWNWSVEDRRNIETFVGLEYQSCCWAVRVVSREYIANRAGEINRSLYIQLELKGLASAGRGTEALLERGILGYSDRR